MLVNKQIAQMILELPITKQKLILDSLSEKQILLLVTLASGYDVVLNKDKDNPISSCTLDEKNVEVVYTHRTLANTTLPECLTPQSIKSLELNSVYVAVPQYISVDCYVEYKKSQYSLYKNAMDLGLVYEERHHAVKHGQLLKVKAPEVIQEVVSLDAFLANNPYVRQTYVSIIENYNDHKEDELDNNQELDEQDDF